MLSFNCKPLRVSQAEYYLDSKEGYYSQDGTVPGVWIGAGARALGLTGRVKDREDVINVLQGFAPHGLKVQNAGKSERRAGYDLTFSAPKSATVLLVKAAELAQKDIRFVEVVKEIRRAQLAAVSAALKEFEHSSIETRVGKGGYAREKGMGAVAIAFEHVTSRPAKGETLPDPQIQTHLVVVNMTPRKDGSVGTVDFEPLRSQQKMLGALYRAQLAYELERRLGVEIERKGDFFEIKGIAGEMLTFFSKRRRDILEVLDRKAIVGDSQAALRACIQTRREKLVYSFSH